MKYLPALAAVCLLIVPSVLVAQQISPNPNPVGNEIEVGTPLRHNGIKFTNFGRIYMNNNGTLTNNFGLINNGTFDNTDGTFVNNGILSAMERSSVNWMTQGSWPQDFHALAPVS